jgi:hypothetical protein
MVILTPTQDFVDSLIAIALDFPEDAVAIHQSVEQVRDLVPLLPAGVLRLSVGYEVFYSSRLTVTGDTEVLLGRIQRVIHERRNYAISCSQRLCRASYPCHPHH